MKTGMPLLACPVFQGEDGASGDLDDPAGWRFDVAALDAGQLVVELLGDRADFFRVVEDVQLAVVLDPADRRDDCGGTAGAGFDEAIEVVDLDIAFDHFKAQARGGQFHQRQTGDARQDGGRFRGDELVVLGDAEEVGRTDFLDLAVGQRVR